MAIRLSRVSKLDGIASWSLPALQTCPGAHENGNLVEVCHSCYATTGRYTMRSVREPREENQADWKEDDWVERMVALLDDHRYFRWFDSGDIYDHRLASKILDVVRQTPWCKHWIPTRSHKFSKLRQIIEQINDEPNAVVRYSSDRIDEFEPHHGSVVVSDPNNVSGVYVCPATTARKNCNGCRACWSKEIKTVAYGIHGARAKKTLRLKADGYFDLATA